MTNIITFFILILLATTTQTGTLKVEISNIRNTKGVVRVALYNSAEGFPRDEEAVIQSQIIEKITKKTHTVYFRNLPTGYYAISLLHDEDNNNEMKFNFWGIPTEGYGFSRNVKPQLKAPSFKDTKVKVNGATSIKINIIYR